MNLLYYPNKFLDKKLDAVEIENMDFDPNELKAEMSDIMLSNQGIGLSASQVGLNKQLFIMGNTRDDIGRLTALLIAIARRCIIRRANLYGVCTSQVNACWCSECWYN